MKKLILFLIPIILIARPAAAQIVWSLYSQSYPAGTTDKPSNIGIMACIPEKQNAFWDISPNSITMNSLQKDSAFLKNRNQQFVAINAFDTTKAEFFLHGVNPANASKWEYRVLQWPDKVVVPWSPVTRFTDNITTAMSGMPQMAYLGGYNGFPGKWLIVDARPKGGTAITTTAVVAWKSIAPRVTGIYTADQLNLFLTRLARPWSYKLTPEEAYKWFNQYTRDQIDMATALPKKLVAQPNENNLIFYLNAGINDKNQLQYQLVRDNIVDTAWKSNDFDNGFIWLRDLKPGDYKLNMRFKVQPEHVVTYPFLVKTAWFDSVWFKIIAWLLSALSLGFIVMYIRFLRQKEKTAEVQSNRNKLQLELKAIYAQLNPHFIFNALTSIQGLMNRQDIAGANSYLADFAKLMRQSLSNGDKEQTPLKQELETLDTYLKLEQLRFGFNYDIQVDEDINVYDTDTPSLLLQPIAENAVKHGVSALAEKGDIQIGIKKQQYDMVVTIADNGPGFSASSPGNGFGLKLTADRTKLLNELLKGQEISMEIKGNSPTGAKIYFTFKNWFL